MIEVIVVTRLPMEQVTKLVIGLQLEQLSENLKVHFSVGYRVDKEISFDWRVEIKNAPEDEKVREELNKLFRLFEVRYL